MEYFDLHTHKKKSCSITSLSPLELIGDDGFYSVGIHPWFLEQNLKEQRVWVRHALNHPCVIALGEIGLDRAIKIDFGLQERVFTEQIEEHGEKKPVIIHCVRSYADFLKLKRRFLSQKWIFHDFYSSPQMIERLIDLNCYFSLGKQAIKNGPMKIPLDHIFIESDEESVDLSQRYLEFSTQFKMSLADFKARIDSNVQGMFFTK